MVVLSANTELSRKQRCESNAKSSTGMSVFIFSDFCGHYWGHEHRETLSFFGVSGSVVASQLRSRLFFVCANYVHASKKDGHFL